MKNFLNKLLIPFAIIHIRIIQYRYKKITTQNYSNRVNQNIAILQLLQAKEYYYKRQFDAWGKFHPKFSFSNDEYKKHITFIDWLFPEKNFKEWDIVIWHKPEAVTYYHNKIFNLSKHAHTCYEKEIPKQIKKWRQESREL
jgi:hypothetical protein